MYYRDTFAESGGGIHSFKYHPSKHTGRCLSLVSPDADRSMVTDLGAAGEMRASELQPSDLEGVQLLHTEGYLCGLKDRSFLPELLKRAKDAGIPVSFDLASYGIVREFRDESLICLNGERLEYQRERADDKDRHHVDKTVAYSAYRYQAPSF